MAKKKSGDARAGDRHLTPVMTIRLGEPARTVLKEMAKAEDRTITAIINRALKLYAKENNYVWGSPKEG